MTTKPILSLLCAALPAFGRIGETPEQCAVRYGEPTKVDEKSGFYGYQKSGIDIVCSFIGGKCATIAFMHHDRDSVNRAPALTEAEREAILEANKGGTTWNKKTAFMKQAWAADDGSMRAEYDEIKHTLIIVTAAAESADVKRSKEQAKTKLGGF